jgi:hypothetical protein
MSLVRGPVDLVDPVESVESVDLVDLADLCESSRRFALTFAWGFRLSAPPPLFPFS